MSDAKKRVGRPRGERPARAFRKGSYQMESRWFSIMVGEKLRSIRKDAGLSQQALSDLTEGYVKTWAITDYESGESLPRFSHIVILAAALRVQLHDLLPLNVEMALMNSDVTAVVASMKTGG